MNVYAAIVNDHRGRLLQTVTRLVFFVVVSSLFSYICFLILRAQELMADIGELLYFSLVFFFTTLYGLRYAPCFDHFARIGLATRV